MLGYKLLPSHCYYQKYKRFCLFPNFWVTLYTQRLDCAVYAKLERKGIHSISFDEFFTIQGVPERMPVSKVSHYCAKNQYMRKSRYIIMKTKAEAQNRFIWRTTLHSNHFWRNMRFHLLKLRLTIKCTGLMKCRNQKFRVLYWSVFYSIRERYEKPLVGA